jgi:hypothetical protein
MRAEEFEFKRNYIMANPIDAGLSKRPDEYQWLWLQKADTTQWRTRLDGD